VAEIETALLSVADKTGLVDFARRLRACGVNILASGGTGRYLGEQGVQTTDISAITGKAEFLGGLVKTLHTAIHAGILADRANDKHMRELQELGYFKIDMVAVDFYPLVDAKSDRSLSFLDIGGPAMARAAAKNFRSCVPIPHSSWYPVVIEALEGEGWLGTDLRWRLARDTIRRTAWYDAATLARVSVAGQPEQMGDSLLLALERVTELRYGENPHQKAAFYAAAPAPRFQVVKGDLSYNNILDVDCCLGQLREFDRKAAVVVKHVGPCGVAQAEIGSAALESAYQCDPLSAFGGVIGVNFAMDAACVALLAKRFVECVVAPSFQEEALFGLRKKRRTRLVIASPQAGGRLTLRSALGGVLVQTPDDILLAQEPRFATGAEPDQTTREDLAFAWKVVKHVKSNAIVLAKDGRTIGIGAGQPSRVDATRIAIRKAREMGHDPKGSVMASDGFFPFPDSLELAAEAGVKAVIQPGGSIRDKEVADRACQLGMVMALTATRHFKH
jgi:phosphoribosylaminoimidazolecarboxamide formyltransferase/IMP cyclohydrolase